MRHADKAAGIAADATIPGAFAAPAIALRRATHLAIAAITEALESFAYNVAVAKVHELSNALIDAERQETSQPGMAWAQREAVATLALLIAPMMPHLAEEMHAALGGNGLVVEQPWPVADPALIEITTVTVAVQVMGKLRATIQLKPGADADTALATAEAEPLVAKLLEGKRIVKRIHVPDRIVNFVVAG
jgi:leucyl-tRNA synthetase